MRVTSVREREREELKANSENRIKYYILFYN